VSEQRWTKSPNEEVRPAKTGWDWLQLLIVPIALAGIGYLLNHAENARDRSREDARAIQAQFIAAENRRDQLLQDYLTRMGDLVLDRRLRESKPGSAVRGVARTLTLTALRRLDGRRKGEVVRFLADSKLVYGPGTPIVTLRDADLRRVVLKGARLRDVVFDAADLRGANFGGASLDVVRFQGSRLERASFTGATLVGVAFTAAELQQASFRRARMEPALTYRGDLAPVGFQGACLSGATFDEADARSARFGLAEGVHVSFGRARLTPAALDGAKLADSELGRARTTALPDGWTKRGAAIPPRARRVLCASTTGNP
jgi:uncharacterized protein YjbI with pentapeptide repeats